MKRYLFHYFRIVKICFMDEMTDRVNFFTWIVVHAVSLLTFIIFFQIIFSQVREINGWNQYQVLLTLGIGTLIGGLGSMTFFAFMYDHPRDVKNGNFDFKLTRPLDVHFQAAFSTVDVDDLSVIPGAIILIVYSLAKLPGFTWINLIPFLILLTCSMTILFSILTLFESLAFKFITIDAVINFYWSIVNVTKNPIKAYKNFSIILSAVLLPIALISSVPAEVLFGRYEWGWITGSIITAIALLIISRKVFMFALEQYSSASS